MARRTKRDAICTRQAIVDAACYVFRHNGVMGASLEKIATAAGVSRGAVYWHFASKEQVFAAVKDDAKLLVSEKIKQFMREANSDDSLRSLGKGLCGFFQAIEKDVRLRLVLEVFTLCCESVDEYSKAGVDPSSIAQYFKKGLEFTYLHAAEQGVLRLGMNTLALVEDSTAFIAGLLYVYLSDRLPDDKNLAVRQMVSTHLDLRRQDVMAEKQPILDKI